MSRWIAAVSAVALCAATVLSFRYERFQPIVAVCTIVLFGVYVGSTGIWPRQRALVLTLALDLTLIFVYLWSLDERVHIVIRPTAGGYVASVGGNVVVLHGRVTTGALGVMASGLDGYKTQPNSDAYSPNPTSPLARFVEFVRLAGPRPAWTNVSLALPGRPSRGLTLATKSASPTGAWIVNRRGELEGTPGSYAMFDVAPIRRFTLQADLARGEGMQGILVRVGANGDGSVLVIRLDRSDAVWLDWRGGHIGAMQPTTLLRLDTLSMLQRDVRLLLSNIMVGLILILVAVPVYALLALFTTLIRADSRFPDIGRGLHPRTADGAALLSAVGAVVATALVANVELERIPHVRDSVVYYFQAQTLALGRLWLPIPRLSDFFVIDEALMRGGHWFGRYPPGWPILLAGGVLVGLPWMVNPVLTGANVLLIYLIGREAYGRHVGLLAALLALSSPFLLVLGGEYMSHTATIFYLNVAVYLFVRWNKRLDRDPASAGREWRLLVPAGFFTGMALITRELDVVLFMLPFLFLFARRPLARSLRTVLLTGLGVALPVAFLLYFNASLTGGPTKLAFTLYDPNDRPGFGLPEGMFGNFTPAEGLWKASANFESLFGHLFGWPFYFTLALAAVPFLLGRAQKWDAIFAASAVLVMLGSIAYWGTDITYGPRHWSAAAPALILLSARGFHELYRWGLKPAWTAPVHPLLALTVPGVLLAFLVACDVSVYLPAQLPTYRGYNRADAASIRAVENAGIHHAVVFVAPGNGNWNVYEVPFTHSSPLLDGDVVYARDLGKVDRALMNLYRGRSFYRLDGTHLKRMTP